MFKDQDITSSSALFGYTSPVAIKHRGPRGFAIVGFGRTKSYQREVMGTIRPAIDETRMAAERRLNQRKGIIGNIDLPTSC